MLKLFTLLLALLPTLALAIPKIQSWSSENGAKVLFIPAPTIPMVDVRIVFDAGSARDGENYGLALMTAALLNEGSAKFNADEIAQRLDDQGIELSAGALRDMAWVTVRSLTEQKSLNIAAETLASVISEPSFGEKALERVRQQTLTVLRQNAQSPNDTANRAFYAALYGKHPYAHHPRGTFESIKGISRTDIAHFHERYYVARNAVVAIVGDLDRAQAKKLANRITAQLPEGQHAPALARVPATQAKIVNETFPSSQTHLLVGQKGITRSDKDYFALYVGNHVFGGGGLTSILGEEVRNKRGLSYSVYSYFKPMRNPGPFLMVAQTKNDQALHALQVMRDTLTQFIEQGPTEQEFNDAKTNITGGFPLKIASNKKLVEYIAMMGFYNLPLDWLDNLVGKVEAVTRDDVKDAFKRRVNPNNLIAVTVGGPVEPTDVAQIEPAPSK